MNTATSQLSAAKTSFFSTVLAKTAQQECTLFDVMQTVASNSLKEQVEAIRAAVEKGRDDEASRLKHKLPAVTTSVITYTRDASTPVEQRFGPHNGFLQIDIDAKDNPQLKEIFDDVRERFKTDKHIAAGFRSPSGNGLKLLLRIADSKTLHKRSWIAAERYFLQTYGLKIDRATSDVARLCFLSYDPEAWISETEAEALPPAEQENATGYSSSRASLSDSADIEEMLSFLNYRPDYPDWLRIASAVWNTVGEAEGTALLRKYLPEERQGEYEKKYTKRLTTINLGTLVHYASLCGYDVKAAAAKKRWAGRIYFGKNGNALSPEIAQTRAESIEAEIEDSAPVVLTQIYIDQCFDRQQRGDAELFASIQRGIYEYDLLSMCWRHYADGVWTRDETSCALIDLQDTVALAYRERIKDYEAESRMDNADSRTKQRNAKKIDFIEKRIAKIYTKAYASSVLEIAGSLLASKASDYDANPYLVACKNKTIDLSFGEARQHSPKDHLTIALNVDFDPDATCPKWEAFLNDIFLNDPALINYIQRIVGYCLSGTTSEDVMFFLIGGGANGKSTFRSALEMLFGKYSSSIKISALLTTTSDSNVDYQKATIKGRRIIWTDEVPEGKRFNESQIKAMVGGDKILARAIFEKPFEFTPTHKLFPVGNHVPIITGTDNGIWRRIVLIPFGATFSEATDNGNSTKKRDRFEILRELQQELPGILNWALRGWLDYSERGLRDRPQAVTKATQEYRDSQDQIACFLDECYTIYPACHQEEKIKAQDIYSAYTHWCEDNGEIPVSKTKRNLMGKLKEQKLEVRQSSGGYYFVFGIRRKEEPTVLSLNEPQQTRLAFYHN